MHVRLADKQSSRSPQPRNHSRVRLGLASAKKPRSRSRWVWNHVEFVFDTDGNAVQCPERSAGLPPERGLTCLRHKVLFVAGQKGPKGMRHTVAGGDRREHAPGN